MPLADLIPWGRNRPLTNPRIDEDRDPFLALHREMNRLFDDFSRGFGSLTTGRAAWPGTWPQVEVTETETEVRVVAELPGMEQKDIEISLQDGVLTLKGEKRSESGGTLYSERWHGQFQRSLELGSGVDPDKVSASFRNGELTILLPKRPEARNNVKRIPISGA
jgi:HSP20 family protein